ncbi:hypothetical protein QFC19_000009 [Naganishia cerealis]|uniref:Uncharacterized protein n=1 Tax=Naganishia cerealis TaxID=610337 RepID=A0ACC2WSM5_9TREE|nr:hypothetical protein QFC19_000009 [Naganishia cerealis]
MVARATAVSSSRIFVRQFTRASYDPAKPFVFAIATRGRCLHTTTPSYLAATPEGELTPGATYVHIPPLEIPASGLVPLEGSVELRVKCVDSNGNPVSTVAHSLAIAKAVEAKCGPIVSISHRRVSSYGPYYTRNTDTDTRLCGDQDPRNGTLLKFMYITLLHPITLTKELGLEIRCHRIPWEHRAAGGPSLEEVERAILEPPGISSPSNSQKNSTSSSQDKQNSVSKAQKTQNEEHDIVFARVSTLSVDGGSSLANKYGVHRRAFNTTGRSRKAIERRRGTKSPKEEKEEDEQILARLTEWKGFYGGYEPLQAIYQPFRPVVQAQTTVEGVGEPFNSTAAQPRGHQAQQQEDKRTLEQRLDAEKAYWRSRREAEKHAKQNEEKNVEALSPGTPSATLLQRLLKGDQPSATAATSSTPPASQNTGLPSSGQHSTPSLTTPANAAASPLNKAQARLVEQARLRAREESSRSGFPRSLLGSSLDNQKQESSSSAVPGFHHMGSEPRNAPSGKGSPSTKKEDEKNQSWMDSVVGLFRA